MYVQYEQALHILADGPGKKPYETLKETLPIAAGQKLALVGKKEKHTVLSVKDNIVTMQWYMSVKPEQVIVNKGVFSGWICVDSTKAM